MIYTSSYVIGIDVGTTSIKGMLVDCIGNMIESAKQEYTLDTADGNICELDANVYWEVTCSIIKELIAVSKVDPKEIKGLAFSSQGETLIVVDADGEPLRKAIVWLDNRSNDEAEEIKKHFGEKYLMNITGQPKMLPIWPATRILWLKKNEPNVFNRAGKFLLVEDYLMFRLTGKYFTEHSLSSSTLYFDVSKKQWWPEMLNYLQITEKQFPTLSPSGKVIGSLTVNAAQDTGLNASTNCITGAYDHPAGAIGSGNISVGDATLTIGASMAMCIALDRFVSDASMNLPCQCHAVENMYFLLPYGTTAGMVLRWFRDAFGQLEVEESINNKNIDAYDLLIEKAETVSAGSDGLIMLPHLMGAGSPEFNSRVKGVFAGITMAMHKGHFVRAIIESVSLMIRHNLEMMREKGIEVNAIHVLGGASRSRLWNQILADITGLPVVTLKNSENSAMGACILAAVGVGFYENIRLACQAYVKRNTQFLPNRENSLLYEKIYKKYVHLYKILEEYWETSDQV